jgi:hypothetical protein
MDDKEEILESLRQSLKDYGSYSSHDDCDTVCASLTSASISTIDLTNFNSNITISGSGGYNFSNANVYASTGATGLDFNWQPSSKIQLNGDDADIEVNGQSLMSMIQGIQDRLNILCPDPEMEQEWNDLRVIREQYEAKLAECREKSCAWKALKQSG